MGTPVRYEKRSIDTKEFSQKIGPNECFVIRDKALLGRDTVIGICNKGGRISVEKIKLPK